MKFIINRKTLISMLFIGLTLLGYVSYKQLSVELLPNVELPYLYVQATLSQEADPEYIENQVVIPIESAVGKLGGIESVESDISSKKASVAVYYNKDVDFSLAYLKLQDKIDEIKSDMPDEVTLSVTRVDLTQSSNMFMELQAIGSGGVDRVRSVVDNDIEPELENLDGIAGVSVYGGREKSLQIILNKKACDSYHVTPATIRSLLSQNTQSRTYVGSLTQHGKLYSVHMTAEYDKVSDLENLVVADGPILLKDVAQVKFGTKEQSSYSRVNGKDAVTIRLVNDSQANQINLSHEAEKLIKHLNEKYKSKDVQLLIRSNSAETMETNIDQIINLAIVGGLLAIFVLWIFLKNIRIVAFIALAIPVSVFTAFNLFYAYGITLNSLTLVGMALAIGMLLDNSVVVLENIYRLSGKGVDPDRAVIQGTSEVWRSVVAATLTTITVFLPFLFSDNYLIEMLGKNIGISIISTLLVSLVVALLLVPAGIHYFLKKRAHRIVFEKVSPHNRMVQIYVLLLKTCMRNPAATILFAVAVFFLTIFGALSVSTNSTTEADTDQVSVSVEMPSGSSLDYTDQMVKKIEAKLDGLKEKDAIYSSVEEEEARITVQLKDNYAKIEGKSFAQIKSEISQMLNHMDPAEITVSSGSSSSSSGSGSGANMMSNFQRLLGIGSNEEEIIIKGEDFSVMERVAENLKYYLGEMDMIDQVRLNVSDNSPEVHMMFDPLTMKDYDVDLSTVASEMNSFSGDISTGVTFNQGTDEYDIIMNETDDGQVSDDDDDDTRTMDDLKQVKVTGSDDSWHEVQDFSKLIYAEGLAGIKRVDQEKQIELTYQFDSDAQDSKDVLEAYRYEIDQLVANYNFPTGVAVEVVHDETDLSDFYFLIFAAIILIFMIMASVFQSISTPFVLLFSIPLAAIGSLLGLIVSGNSLYNANSMIGFLILLGVVVNNGIILIDYTNILRKRGFRRPRALIVAGLSRVRPILITAVTTIVAMIPLALGQAEYVSIIGAPFAIIVIGGLALSTLLTLVFIPTFYSGLENALNWFRHLNLGIKLVQFAAMIALTILIFVSVDDFVWRLLDFIVVIVAIPGATWFVLNSLKKASTRLIDPSEEIHIQIQNLVKIYDRPGRFSREWNGGKSIRKHAGVEKEYSKLKDFDQYLWQIPLLAFLCYFTFSYLSSMVWMSILSIFIYNYIRTIYRPAVKGAVFYYQKHQNRFMRFMAFRSERFLFWLLPFIELIFLNRKINYVAWVITFGILWYLALIIGVTANRLYDQNVNINRLKGSARRGFYRMVKQIPFIGKRKVPFKALNGVSLDIKSGMFGLLGPNGAGKSTLMRIVCGIFEQSYGKIWVNGIDTQEKREELQGLIGYLPQEFGTYENMPAWDFLEYQALLKGLTDKKVRDERLEYVLKAVHMYDHRTEKIGSFSGGMKQRIGIAQILLHLPRILVVDEPTAGLDPRERIRFRNLLVELSRDRIVIFSTHIIEDIASSCNQVGVVIRGNLKYHGNPMEMVHLAKNLVWQFDIPVADFEEMEHKDMVVHHMRVGENIRVRMLSHDRPAENAVVVNPLLEDAYLCLIKDLK